LKVKVFAAIAALVLCLPISVLFADDMSANDKAMQEEMMKKWQAFATPGDVHKVMAGMVGTWDTVVKSYSEPSTPETKGTSTFTSIMDGRYIQENAEGNFMGMPFHGIGTFGYDNAMKKYVGSWVDNMGTGIMVNWGTSDDGGKTINWMGKATDPMTGTEQNYRSVMHMMTNDQYHFEMYGPGMDGKEMKMMEITYTRKK